MCDEKRYMIVKGTKKCGCNIESEKSLASTKDGSFFTGSNEKGFFKLIENAMGREC